MNEIHGWKRGFRWRRGTDDEAFGVILFWMKIDIFCAWEACKNQHCRKEEM